MGTFVIKVADDRAVALYDLAVCDLQEIADRHGLKWSDLLTGPGAHGGALEDIFRLCCKEADVEPPKRLSARRLLESLEFEEADDLPRMYEDGLPVPKAGEN